MNTRMIIALFLFAVNANTKAQTVKGTNDLSLVIEVTATPILESYRGRKTDSASRIAVNPAVLPASVYQITPKVIEDTGFRSQKEVVSLVPGVFNYSDQGHVLNFGKFYLRGFPQVYSYRDGMRQYGGNVVDIDTLDCIDVVKGPDSTRYGQTEVGGLVNYVTKGASLDAPYKNTLIGSISDTGRYRGAGETGGRVSDSLATFAGASYSGGKTFRDVEKEIYTANIGTAWKLSEDTTLDFRAVYTHERRDMDSGVPYINGHRVGSIHHFWGDPTLDGLTIDDLYTTMLLTHRFSESVTSRTRVSFHAFNNDMDALRFPSYTSGRSYLTARYDGSECRLWEEQFNQDLEWHGEWGKNLENTLLGGVEGRLRNYVWHKRWINGYQISLTKPTFTGHPGGGEYQGRQYQNHYSFAPYLQNDLKLFDSLHLTAGIREDVVHQELKNIGESTYSTFDDDALSGNIGLLYELFPWLHPYFSLSTSFQPQMGGVVDAAGNRIDPETGIQYEGGLKIPVLDNRLLFTLSAFQIEKKHVATLDSISGEYRDDGELKSSGIEVSAQGEIGKYLQAIAAYAYTDTEAVESQTYAKGANFEGIAHNSASSWLVYRLEGNDSPSGLRLGGGVTSMDSRKGDAGGTFSLPGYYTVNAMTGYGFPLSGGRALDLQLNVYNLLDERYYESGSSVAAVMPGAPLGAMLTVKFTF